MRSSGHVRTVKPYENMNEIHLLNQISKERLWETNSAIAQWPRHSGTDTERAAFNYVQKRLDHYGLQTTL